MGLSSQTISRWVHPKTNARLCVRGDKQVPGIDFTQSYSPVVQWTSIGLILILSLVLNWQTVQTDYTNAFAQSTLAEEVYMEIPKDFMTSHKNNDYILKLNKSWYGLRQAPLSWFAHLKEHLEQRGFVSSKVDQCLFINHDKKIFFLVYIDDVVWVAPDRQRIDKVLESHKDEFEMTVEGDVTAFLGIQFKRLSGREIEMQQTGLIERVLKATGLQDCNPDKMPASQKPLGTDKDCLEFAEQWSYSSVVGMWLYLVANSRPEIAYAVHQCARFTHNPKASHGAAVK